jgi:hypothetical protein
VHAALQVAKGRWVERIFVVLGQVLGGNLGVSTFLVSGLNAGPFRNECRFGSGRGTGLGFTGSFGLPLQDRFPILDFFSVKLFFPFCGRQRTLGAMVVGLVAPCAAVRLDVIEQLVLGIAGDFSAVDREVGSGRLRPAGKLEGFSWAGRWSRAVFWRDWSLSFFSLPGAGGSRLFLSSGVK